MIGHVLQQFSSWRWQYQLGLLLIAGLFAFGFIYELEDARQKTVDRFQRYQQCEIQAIEDKPAEWGMDRIRAWCWGQLEGL